ncbi:XrtA/PEP-CTERM system TPR-repeat protein PrsT [Pseudorhodoferax sp.]|uniref:XrtA/PEP-CTERM system TPR-repeat protein PrsT n=1 Tax=Pseudorhodoferax sp. TaxID=1993553 RepID=UPI002DD6956F|nr:XrtA/PEP-CTERM system TPR-repeat protein PrsT [Pseudorhodoferax sp.]
MPHARRWRGALAAFALCAILLPALAADPRAARLYEDALSRYEKRDLAGAVLQLKNALQIDKNLLPVHVLLGKVLLADDEVVASAIAFEEALRLGVNRAEVVLPYAQALMGQGKGRQVLEDPRFADTGLAPDTRYALLVLKAKAADDTGDRRLAQQTLEQARAIDATSPESWFTEVTMRVRAGQMKEALAAADKALQLAPGKAQPLYLRGTVSHVQGDLKTALGYYDKALQAEPDHAEGLVSRAGLLLDLNRPADAKRDVAQLLKSEAQDPRGAYLSSLIAEREGRTADAKAALQRVTTLLDPAPIEMLRQKPQYLMLGALSHYGLDQTEKAKPYLEAVLRDQPGSTVARIQARIQIKEGNIEQAIQTLDGFLRRQPGDPQATLLLASAHMAHGRHARAVLLLQGALQRDNRPEYQTALGTALMKGGRFKDAQAELEQAFKRDPKQVSAGTALAALHLQLGQPTRAVAVAEQLVKLQPTNPGLLHLLGTARAEAGNLDGARQALEQAAKADARFVDPQVELARLDLRRNNPEAALTRLNAVVAQNGRHVGALTLLGQLMASRGRLDEAQRWLEKADDHTAPDVLDAGMRLVEFHLANNQPERAREAVKRITSKAPDALRVLVTQARVELAAGDNRAARSLLSRASGVSSFDVASLLRIAELQLAAEDLPGAAHSAGKALKEAPTNFDAQVMAARVDLLQGNLAAAEQQARQIAASSPRRGVGHTLLGDVALARQQPAAAVEAYRRAHQIDNSSASLLRLFGLLTINQPAEAMRLAEAWLKTRPNDFGVRRTLADAQARAANWPAARSSYEALLKGLPDDAEALNNLANVLLITKDKGALQVAERALSLKPTAAHIIGTTGWAAFQAGQNDRALQLLRDARLRDPANAQTRFHLASVLAGTGRKTEARAELEAALRTDPAFASAHEAEQLLRSLN